MVIISKTSQTNYVFSKVPFVVLRHKHCIHLKFAWCFGREVEGLLWEFQLAEFIMHGTECGLEVLLVEKSTKCVAFVGFRHMSFRVEWSISKPTLNDKYFELVKSYFSCKRDCKPLVKFKKNISLVPS